MNFLKNIVNIFWAFIFILILGSVYYRWFTLDPIIGGDWPYFFNETLKEFPIFFPSWNTWLGNGWGGTHPIYFLQMFQNFTVFFATFLNIPWVIVYKVLWFGGFITLSVFSSIYLSKSVLRTREVWVYLMSSLIFAANTYVLMLVDGGQMGIALAYSVTPLVLGIFIKIINLISSSDFNSKLKIQNSKFSVFAGLVLSLQVLFDPRIAYITMIGIALYFSFNVTKNMVKNLHLILFVFVIPSVIAVLLHATWILPLLIARQNVASELGDAYSSLGIVKFLSFASFSQTLSLLQSNWPENIFGKVGFMKSEFLVISILAYSSLLFISKIKYQISKIHVKNQKNNSNKTIEQFNNRIILFFALLGIIGAFLAKGANPPFGNLYLWLFDHVQGFVFFRDSTKFYLFTILSYSVLIPYSFLAILNKVSSIGKHVHIIKFLLLTSFVLFWLFTIRQAVTGQLNGTFKYHEIPNEYFRLKDFLSNQPDFFRTFWIPRQQRFTYYSTVHPSLEATHLFNTSTSTKMISMLKKPAAKKYFEGLNIKYVIVPYDSLGEIFQKDRKYDEAAYRNVINELNGIAWLKKVDGFGKIAVFQTPYYNDHINLSGNGKITSEMSAPYRYLVTVSIDKPQRLIFSEKYNPDWVIKDGKNTVHSQKTPIGFNSFKLSKRGTYSFEIYFSQEDYYFYGRIISIVTILIAALIFILPRSFLLRN